MDKYLDQKSVGKACLYIAKAMEEYSNAGPKDMAEVSEYLTKAMDLVSNKLTPTNQDRFAEWLTKEADRVREEIGAQ